MKAAISFFSLPCNSDLYRHQILYRLPPDSDSLNYKFFFQSFALKKKKVEGRKLGEGSIKFLTLPIPNLFIFPQFLPYFNPDFYLPYNSKEFGKYLYSYTHSTFYKEEEDGGITFSQPLQTQFIIPHDDLI